MGWEAEVKSQAWGGVGWREPGGEGGWLAGSSSLDFVGLGFLRSAFRVQGNGIYRLLRRKPMSRHV